MLGVDKANKKVEQVKGDWECRGKGQFPILSKAIGKASLAAEYSNLLHKFTWEFPLTTSSLSFANVQWRNGTRLWP